MLKALPLEALSSLSHQDRLANPSWANEQNVLTTPAFPDVKDISQ